MVITVATATIGLAGCVSDVVAPRQTLWEATLQGGPEHPLVTGSAAAISRATSTEASIEVAGLDVGGTYAWRIRAGACDAPGDVLGADGVYPELVAEEEPVSADAVTGDLMLSGRAYHAEVREADTGNAAACGHFIERG